MPPLSPAGCTFGVTGRQRKATFSPFTATTHHHFTTAPLPRGTTKTAAVPAHRNAPLPFCSIFFKYYFNVAQNRLPPPPLRFSSSHPAPPQRLFARHQSRIVGKTCRPRRPESSFLFRPTPPQASRLENSQGKIEEKGIGFGIFTRQSIFSFFFSMQQQRSCMENAWQFLKKYRKILFHAFHIMHKYILFRYRKKKFLAPTDIFLYDARQRSAKVWNFLFSGISSRCFPSSFR